ncbi:MAG: 4a-hydroxytetrahydrobiopterin dehydratase [Pseudomonadota bacterium]
MSLDSEKCEPCQGDVPKVTNDEMKELMQDIPQWNTVTEDGVHKLKRTYKFKNFRHALSFTNRVGELAESEQHHPEITTEWGKTTVTWWTHAIDGLHRNDFIMAAKTDKVFDE